MNSPRLRTLNNYTRAARRHKSTVILTMLVFSISAGLAVKQVANNYESSASIVIETPYPVEPVRRADALQQRITDRARLEALIAGHDLFKQKVEKGERIDDLISEVQTGISVRADSSRENQFIISFRAADPKIAQEITAELAGQLVRENSKAAPAQSNPDEADRLRQRAAELSSQLHQLEDKSPWLLAINEAAPAPPAAPAARSPQPSPSAIRAQQMTIESLKDQQYLIQQQLADLERRLATQRQLVEQQKKGSTLRDNPTYAVLISKRAELQGQRDTLVNRQELTDKHPRVTAIIDQINAINRQIEELRQQDAGLVSQSPEARELASLESERNRLNLELEINNREMARRLSNTPAQAASQAPAVSAAQRDIASSRLAQQYLGLKRNYEELMARVKDADSNRQPPPDAQAEQFRLVQQATMPRQPLSRSRWPLTLAALAAGLALGAGFAVLADARRLASLQDAGDVERYARVPLLASIPASLTEDERKLAARQAKVRLALGTLIAAAATLALSHIFIITNIFALLGEK